MLWEIWLPKIVTVKDSGVVSADILISHQKLQSFTQRRTEVSHLHIFIVYSLLTPLSSPFNWGNHCNVFNVFRCFLINCVMCFTYIFKIYIYAIVLHISVYLFSFSTTFFRSLMLPCAHVVHCFKLPDSTITVYSTLGKKYGKQDCFPRHK